MRITKKHFQRSDGNLWLTVFSVLNASFTDLEIKIKWEGENGGSYLMVCIVTCGQDELINVYPISMGTLVIIVPAALPYPEIYHCPINFCWIYYHQWFFIALTEWDLNQ